MDRQQADRNSLRLIRRIRLITTLRGRDPHNVAICRALVVEDDTYLPDLAVARMCDQLLCHCLHVDMVSTGGELITPYVLECTFVVLHCQVESLC